MKIFGFEITRRKAAIPTVSQTGQLQGVDSNRGWVRILESWAGAWQHNVEVTVSNVTQHPAVFACTTLIANDISKMRMRLVQQDADGIWNEAENPSFSPVLRKPNHYQNRIQFYWTWVMSLLLHGNTYVLKIRDSRSVVIAKYVLDPQRVRPLVAPNGDVYYQLARDDLSRLPQTDGYTVPATEIIHDRINCLFHPLVGLSPIYACGLAAVQGLNIENSQVAFFEQGGRPGGILTAPGEISQPTADRLKAYFDANFTGENAGKVAVVGDGLKYERLTMSAADAQIIAQLKWTNEVVCSCYHVPPYMVGFGPPPNYNNIEALTQGYYSQGLQILIESIELCEDEGMGLTTGEVASKKYGTEFDLADLLRMDSATLIKFLKEGKDYFTPNEGRLLLNLKRVKGGDTVYRQQQDFSIEALSKRDAKEDPFGKPTPPTPQPKPTLPPGGNGGSKDVAHEHVAAVLQFALRSKREQHRRARVLLSSTRPAEAPTEKAS
jgi:HK97 family phage portal protein